MTSHGWFRTLRFICLIIGVGGAFISAQYSVGGFTGYDSTPELVFAGWFAAILCIVLELVWRKPGMERNLTAALGGIFAYLFGIITSFVGMWIGSGIGNPDTVGEWLQLVIYAIFAVLFEISPEPLMTWGLTGESQADILGGLREMINGDARPIPQYDKKNQQYFQNYNNRNPQQQHEIPEDVKKRLDEFRNQRHQEPAPPQRTEGGDNPDRPRFQGKRGRPSKKVQEPILHEDR